jgi:hypothetical protein
MNKSKEAYQKLHNLLIDTTSSAPKVTPYILAAPDTNNSTIRANDNTTTTLIPSDITDVFEVKWTQGVTQYSAALILRQDTTGIMRVKYFGNGHTNLIEETMELAHTDHGDCLKGYNPTFIIGTSTSKYFPDNLFVFQDENGNTIFKNVDDAGGTYACTVNTSTDYSEKKNFLADFEWKLN